MLCTRHFYYRIFHAHKPVIRSFSSWLNLPIIFGGQFKQILNRNVLFKTQEFCQRNKFCNGNDDGIHSHPGDENANLSSNFLSLKSTNNLIKPDDHLVLETQFLELDVNNKKQLRLKLEKGKSGQKFFEMKLKKSTGHLNYFPKIPVPEDAYAFVRALDELIGELAAENFEQKLLIQDTSQLTDDEHQLRSKIKLRTVEVIGLFHKFHLELVLFININKNSSSSNVMMMIKKDICLELISFHKNETITPKRTLTLPLQTLPWLRNQMAEMLVKHDGTTKVFKKEALAQIPKQFFKIDVFHAHPIPNGISSTNRSLATKQQCLEATGKRRFENLETRMLRLGQKKTLKLKLDKGWKGHKLFEIILKTTAGKYIDFPNILVPEDAYSFVRALDEFIEELASDKFEQKLNIQADIPHSTVKNANTSDNQPKNIIKLKIVELIGLIHKFQLELVVFIDMEKGMMEKEICIRFFATNKTISYEKGMILPLQALPWLRKQMAEMLAKYDGTEPIEDAPAQIPKQFFPKDVFHAPPTQKVLNQKEMRPQLVNKNPSSLPKMQNSKQIGFKNQKMFGHLAIQQITNLKQPKMANKNRTEQLDPKIALERGIQTLFDFNDEEMENYRRIAAKIKHPTKH